MTLETYPDSTTRVFGYDANSNIIKVEDQNATEVTYAYDTRNLLTKKTFSITASHIKGESTQVDFEYDPLNRLTYAKDTDSKVYYTYNTLSLVESEEMRYITGLTSTGKIVAYDYDDQGLVIKCRYPGATSTDGQLEYEYDAMNRLSRLKRRVSSTAVNVATWTLKGPSRVIKKDYGNGTWVDVTYDSRANVSTITHKKPDDTDGDSDPEKVFACAYGYDDAGKVKSEALEFFDDDGVRDDDAGFVYSYDKAFRLTKLYRGVPAAEVGSNPPTNYSKKVEYTFDANSNRVTVAKTPNGGSTVNDIYTTNSTNSYTDVSWGGSSEGFAYDAAGNRTSCTDLRSWTYDYQNHLYGVTIDDDNYAVYQHDALGRRIQKQYDYTGLNPSSVKRFYYAGAALIQEYDYSETTPVIDVEYFYGQAIEEPVYIRKYDLGSSGTLEQDGFYHQNAYGSVYAISGTNSPVTLVENYRYTEYGELTVNSGDGHAGGATPFGNKWMWQCHYYDFEVTNVASGHALYGDQAQAYDPEIGATITRNGSSESNKSKAVSPSDRSVSDDTAGDTSETGPAIAVQSERPNIGGTQGSGHKGYLSPMARSGPNCSTSCGQGFPPCGGSPEESLSEAPSGLGNPLVYACASTYVALIISCPGLAFGVGAGEPAKRRPSTGHTPLPEPASRAEQDAGQDTKPSSRPSPGPGGRKKLSDLSPAEVGRLLDAVGKALRSKLITSPTQLGIPESEWSVNQITTEWYYNIVHVMNGARLADWYGTKGAEEREKVFEGAEGGFLGMPTIESLDDRLYSNALGHEFAATHNVKEYNDEELMLEALIMLTDPANVERHTNTLIALKFPGDAAEFARGEARALRGVLTRVVYQGCQPRFR